MIIPNIWKKSKCCKPPTRVWCDCFLESSCPLKSLESENGLRKKKKTQQLQKRAIVHDLPRSTWKSPPKQSEGTRSHWLHWSIAHLSGLSEKVDFLSNSGSDSWFSSTKVQPDQAAILEYRIIVTCQIHTNTFGGFHKWGTPKMDGL